MSILDQAIETHKLKGLWALYSGGHDSLVSTHIASQHPAFRGVIHINTKTGVIAEKVSRYVQAVCESQGWRMLTKSPFTTYAMLVTKHGFPAPPAHPMMYQFLKERPLDAIMPEAKKFAGGAIGLVTGIRRAESQQRSNMPEFDKRRNKVWINPIVDWSKQQCSDYINEHRLTANAISLATGISGECKCGAYASPDERKIDAMMFPAQEQYLQRLEKLVAASRELQLFEAENGLRSIDDVIPQWATEWGGGRIVSKSQMTLGGDFDAVMCSTCSGRLDADGNVGIDPDLMMLAAKMERARE